MITITMTGEKEEEEAHDNRVSKVEDQADKSFKLELRGAVVNTVDEDIGGGESTCHERMPPPVIVLTAVTAHRPSTLHK